MTLGEKYFLKKKKKSCFDTKLLCTKFHVNLPFPLRADRCDVKGSKFLLALQSGRYIRELTSSECFDAEGPAQQVIFHKGNQYISLIDEPLHVPHHVLGEVVCDLKLLKIFVQRFPLTTCNNATLTQNVYSLK